MSSPMRPILSRPTGPPVVSVDEYALAAVAAWRQAAAGFAAGLDGSLRSNVALRWAYVERRCFWLKYVWIAVNGSCQRQTTTTQTRVRTPTVSTSVPRIRTGRRSAGLTGSAPRAEIARDHGDRLAGIQ